MERKIIGGKIEKWEEGSKFHDFWLVIVSYID